MIIWIVEFTDNRDPKNLLYWGIEFNTKNEALAFIKREFSVDKPRYRYAALYYNRIMDDYYSRPTFYDSQSK